MTPRIVRTASLLIALTTLAALPLAAQVIPKGVDYWVTKNDPTNPNRTTFVTFKEGDVETLCHATARPSWNHKVVLRGTPAAGADWDSAVARLDPATFNAAGIAVTRVRFKSLALASTKPSDTPCGLLNWEVRLAHVRQPITKMEIHKVSAKGGFFDASLALRVEMRATRAATGSYLGSLFYDIKLPDPQGGTGWSFSNTQAFRPGIDTASHCVDVLRQKLGNFAPDSRHFYYISNLIAKGLCRGEAG